MIKRATEIADLLLKICSILALAAGGVWAYYQFNLSGSGDWAINLDMATEVLPYKDNLRLLVVHVKSKNPRNSPVDLEKPKASFLLTVRKVPETLKATAIIEPGKGGVLAREDLLPKDGFLLEPNAEFEDVSAIVLPVGSIVSLTVELQNGDYNNVGRIVRVTP